jgi:hypothetical protein
MVLDDNGTWDNNNIMRWDYEGTNVIYLPSKEEKEYYVDIVWLLKD